MNKQTIGPIFAVFLLWGCSPSPSTPEGLLKMYVRDVTTKKLGKDYYLKHTAGDLKESVENMEEEELAERSHLKNVKNAKVDVLNKNCQGNKCALTYTVDYEAYKGNNQTFSAETKKLAELIKVEDEWKISNVTNLKTYYEAKEPIEPMKEEQ